MLKASVAALAVTLAISSTAYAAQKKPTGVFRKSTCQSVHSACIDRCINSGKEGTQLNKCSESCAGKYLRCKDRQTRS